MDAHCTECKSWDCASHSPQDKRQVSTWKGFISQQVIVQSGGKRYLYRKTKAQMSAVWAEKKQAVY